MMLLKKQTSEFGVVRNAKKCRYFNRGYCKYKHNCKYLHPKEICKEYLVSGTCGNVECCERHPRVCKWIESNGRCKRNSEYDYLRVTIANKKTLLAINVHHVKTHGKIVHACSSMSSRTGGYFSALNVMIGLQKNQQF